MDRKPERDGAQDGRQGKDRSADSENRRIDQEIDELLDLFEKRGRSTQRVQDARPQGDGKEGRPDAAEHAEAHAAAHADREREESRPNSQAARRTGPAAPQDIERPAAERENEAGKRAPQPPVSGDAGAGLPEAPADKTAPPPRKAQNQPQQGKAMRNIFEDEETDPQDDQINQKTRMSFDKVGGGPAKSQDVASHGHTGRFREVSLEDFEKKNRKQGKKGGFSGSAFAGVAKLVLYIAFVAICCYYLSTNIIKIGNDVFAFVKEPKTVTIELPAGIDTKQLGELLHENGIIEYPGIFAWYADFRISRKSYLTGEFLQGEQEVSSTQNYDQIINQLSLRPSQRQVVRITFPEGSTTDEILALLESNGVGKKEDYIYALQAYPFDYDFVRQLTLENLSSDRLDGTNSYRLEGYLFPDTYDFYSDENPESVINKFLENFNRKFEEEYRDRCEAMGYSIDQVLTIASLIEKEAKRVDEYGIVSSVFHNRLKSTQYPYLESDATVQYALRERKSELTGEDTKIVHPYNTYLNKGLPPGPICNSGLEAISAALYPEETDYYFFVSKKDGTTLFAKTYSEHLENIRKARAGE